MRGIARSDGSRGDAAEERDRATRYAFDCCDPIHEEAHFTADDDAVLMAKVLGHFAEYHPDVPEDVVREMVVTRSYLEGSSGDDSAEAESTARGDPTPS
jgi:hypothetical protein